jgi:hypothetical protein
MDSGRIFTHPAVLQYINAAWSLVAIYWVVGMVLAKLELMSVS